MYWERLCAECRVGSEQECLSSRVGSSEVGGGSLCFEMGNGLDTDGALISCAQQTLTPPRMKGGLPPGVESRLLQVEERDQGFSRTLWNESMLQLR